MLVWPLFRRLPGWALAVLGGILALAGLYLRGMVVDFSWLFFLGLTPTGFQSGDYFPLLPNLGFFLLGAALGKTCYREKRSRLPRVNTSNPCLRLLCFCGRQSLPIYLLHQPILAGILGLAAMLKP